MFGTMSIVFYPKKKQSKKDGMVSLYARITVNGQRSEFSLGRKVDAKRWCSLGGKLKGTTRKVSELNSFLDQVRNRCHHICDAIIKDGERVSALAITEIYTHAARKAMRGIKVRWTECD